MNRRAGAAPTGEDREPERGRAEVQARPCHPTSRFVPFFRYLDDEDVKRLALGLRFIIREDRAKRALDELIAQHWPDAAGMTAPAKTTALVRRASTARKYGAGGEGEDHKRLKKWVAQHPAEIGMRGVTHAKPAHVFDCGDTVDVLFTQADPTFTVVEIETFHAYPGALQAVKYRAIQCAQLRQPLDSRRVRAALVACIL